MAAISAMPIKQLFLILVFSLAGLRSAAAIELKEVADGVFVHQGVHELPDGRNRGEIANIGFIVGSRCVAVVDTGGSPQQGRELKAAIERTTRVPICYVVNTHVHPDHIYGNRAFRQPGVSFFGHHKLAQAMAVRAPFYLEKAQRELNNGLSKDDFIPPDQVVQDRLDLDLGGRRLTLTAHGPAHTDTDLSIFDDKTQTLWLADLLFEDHLPVVDGSLAGWLKELEKLRSVQAKRAIPGHGPAAADWPAAAEAELSYLTRLREEVRGFVQRGRTLEQALDQAGRSLRGNWRLFDEFHKRNVSSGFAELEWEDP
jgi:quinoprotein relay system zinc metallohydrolase 2